MAMEHRRRIRYNTKQKIIVRFNHEFQGMGIIRNINVDGLFFEFAHMLGLHSKVELDVVTATQNRSQFKLHCWVVHATDNGYGALFVDEKSVNFAEIIRLRYNARNYQPVAIEEI